MNASDTQAASPPAVVRPSWLVAVVMSPLTKVLNPVMRKLAGGRHMRMAAEIRHVGRRSGRPYVTPAGARLTGDTFVIPLTFGNQSDWSRNVRASAAARSGWRAPNTGPSSPSSPTVTRPHRWSAPHSGPSNGPCSGCSASGSTCCSAGPTAESGPAVHRGLLRSSSG